MGVIRRKARSLIRRKIRTPLRRKVRRQVRRVTVRCGTCGKRYANPLTHTCAVKTDFTSRKAARARKEKAGKRRAAAAARRRRAAARRREAAARRKAAAAERRRAARARPPQPRPRQSHDYRTCRDQDCERHVCAVFREGMQACPLPHQG